MNFFNNQLRHELSDNQIAFGDPMILADLDLMIALLCFVTRYVLLRFFPPQRVTLIHHQQLFYLP